MPATRVRGPRGYLLAALVLGLVLGVAAAPMAMSQTASPKTSNSNTKTTAKAHHLQTYKTESEAKSACRADTVVWHSSGSKVYHTSGSKYFGKTKHGAYACEKAAKADGLRLGKS